MILTWLVVAENSKAQIFKMESLSGPLETIDTIDHTDARLHERDMTSDLPGRISGNGGSGSHVYESKVSPKDQSNINFAKKIANELDAARKKARVKRIILVAAPDLLGNIRNSFNAETKKLVYFELAKNLAHLSPREITDYVADALKEI